VGTTSPTTPEPECDTFAIAIRGRANKACSGRWGLRSVPRFHLCLPCPVRARTGRHGAGKHFSLA
jgi:hypothetical protein